jgi:bis(5'-nucleosyl)-tetraphosphatase (symmetrical)
MAVYAVGDIQGCLKPLQIILNKIHFDPAVDHLWIAGDIVNRGPHSLETLRFIYSIRHAVELVLGNHDLHLLALAAGCR